MFCNYRNKSVYEVLSERHIKAITIKSFQFSEKGKTLLKMELPEDIHYFRSWFKPSIKTTVAKMNISRFKPDGIVEILTDDDNHLIIDYQLMNCYRMKYKGKYIYERFSYQFGNTLLELFEEEAKNRGQKFKP